MEKFAQVVASAGDPTAASIGSQGKRAFVTGADGFIGSRLTEHLRLGVNVRVFVLYNSFTSSGGHRISDVKNAAQFHPEPSGSAGPCMLKKFLSQ